MTQVMDNLPARVNGNDGSSDQMVTRRGAVVDASEFANLLDSNKFEHLWRVAKLFSASQLVPAHYQGQPENCFIASQMAMRMGVDPFMFMQNTYIVHGRPGMEAKLAIALINSSGLFEDALDYEIKGTDASAQNYEVRAFAVRRGTGKRVTGPWVTWKIVKAEQWDSKAGSTWKTIPDLMFQYRAASWFGKLHCPERLMGMQTVEEIKEIEVDAGAGRTMPVVTERGVKGLMSRVENVTSRPVSEGQTFEPDPATLQQAEAERQRVTNAEAERILREKSPSAQEKREPDVGPPNQIPPEQETDAGNEAEMIGLHEALDDVDDAKRSLLARARAKIPNLARQPFEGAVFKWLAARNVGDFKNSTFEQRLELWREIEAGTFPPK